MDMWTATIESVEIREEEKEPAGYFGKARSMLAARVTFMADGGHAIYNIRMTRGDQSYWLVKRFSDFTDLHTKLKGKFGDKLGMYLPCKTMFRSFDEGELEDRKNALNAYFKDLCRRPELMELEACQRFFEAPGTVQILPGVYLPPAQPTKRRSDSEDDLSSWAR